MKMTRVTLFRFGEFLVFACLEEPEDVGDHDGDAGEGGADDAGDGLRRLAPARLAFVVHLKYNQMLCKVHIIIICGHTTFLS